MDIKSLDHQYVANTYNRFPVEIVSGHGSVVTDRDGKDYIDLGTGIAVNAFQLPRRKRRDILFVFAGLVVCIAAMFVGALGDFSPRERKDFALVALIILAALTALLVGALVWNRKRK